MSDEGFERAGHGEPEGGAGLDRAGAGGDEAAAGGEAAAVLGRDGEGEQDPPGDEPGRRPAPCCRRQLRPDADQARRAQGVPAAPAIGEGSDQSQFGGYRASAINLKEEFIPD
jgi:hypothetical protein